MPPSVVNPLPQRRIPAPRFQRGDPPHCLNDAGEHDAKRLEGRAVDDALQTLYAMDSNTRELRSFAVADIINAYNTAGFDPGRDVLQSYGDGWRSGQFLPQERQFFGIPGGIVNDWTLMTNLEGLFAAGDVLFASDCVGHAAATGHYAGRRAVGIDGRVASGLAPQVTAAQDRRISPPEIKETS